MYLCASIKPVLPVFGYRAYPADSQWVPKTTQTILHRYCSVLYTTSKRVHGIYIYI